MQTHRDLIIAYSQREGSSAIVTAIGNTHPYRLPLARNGQGLFEDLDWYLVDQSVPVDSHHRLPHVLDQVFWSGRLDYSCFNGAVLLDSRPRDAPIAFKWRPWGDPDSIARVLRSHDVAFAHLMRVDILALVSSLYMTDHVLAKEPDPVLGSGHVQFGLSDLPAEERAAARRRLMSRSVCIDEEVFAKLMEDYIASKVAVAAYGRACGKLNVVTGNLIYEDFCGRPEQFANQLAAIVGRHLEPDPAGSSFRRVFKEDVLSIATNASEVMASPRVATLLDRWRHILSEEPQGSKLVRMFDQTLLARRFGGESKQR